MRKIICSIPIVALLLVCIPACGSDADNLCGKEEECAKKAGTPFSKTECEDNFKKAKEEAKTAGCEDEYSKALSCAADIDFECSDNFDEKLSSECGAKERDLVACMTR